MLTLPAAPGLKLLVIIGPGAATARAFGQLLVTEPFRRTATADAVELFLHRPSRVLHSAGRNS